MFDIRTFGKSKITIEEIAKLFEKIEYIEIVNLINKLITEGVLTPIENSKTNGKKPALYNAYHIKKEEKDYSDFIHELQFLLNNVLNIDYYLSNLSMYEKDRTFVLQLSHYMDNYKDKLNFKASMNERSFEIWKREKFLTQEGGKTILKNLGLSIDCLNIYETYEPIAYFSIDKETPQNILIIENKDTFYSMKKYLLDGNKSICGKRISTLIYGGGKGVSKKFKQFSEGSEPYLTFEGNAFYYFGDIDYEGILIYESLKDVFEKTDVFKEGYLSMIQACRDFKHLLPESKDGQNKNIRNCFLDAFDVKDSVEIREILESGKYIPQEILTIRDFQKGGRDDF